MKRNSSIFWFGLAGLAALVAVFSLVAQDIKSGLNSSAPIVAAPVSTNTVESEAPAVALETQEVATGAGPKSAPAAVASNATAGAAAEKAPEPGAESEPAPTAPLAAMTVREATDSESAAAAQAEETVLSTGMNVETNHANANLISIALDEVPLLDVVRMFTRISGANIIATATNLRGTVTVNIQDVEWKPALNSILSMHGLTLTETAPGSQIYTIVQRPVGQPEPLVVNTLSLQYASSSNVVSIIKPLLDDKAGENVSAFSSRNMVIVRATAAKMLDIEKIVKSTDMPQKQVYIEVKFIELSDSSSKNIGVNWSSLEGYNVKMDWGWQASEERTTTKTRTDISSQNDYRYQSDTLAKQYNANNALVAGGFAPAFNSVQGQDVSGSGNASRGSGRQVADTISKGKNASTEQTTESSLKASDLRNIVLTPDSLNVVISALLKDSANTLASNPKVIVANEETAQIHIGRKEPNIKSTVTPGQQGQANTTTYALDSTEPYFKVGITLEVTPTVNTASNITVRIKPQSSAILEYKKTADGNSFPVTEEKTVETIFSLTSGKTAVIGGLTQTSDDDTTTKVPLLGSIPILGKYLFSSQSKKKSQIETIIFVTVGLASPADIEKQNEIGLPDNANLIQRHTIKAATQKKEYLKEIEELKRIAATNEAAILNSKKK
jgi:type II secretory pathway component GspD/PulD (secretin)